MCFIVAYELVIAGVTTILTYDWWYAKDFHSALAIIQGVSNGMILAASQFVYFTSSWYTPRQLPIRLIIWASVPRLVSSMVLATLLTLGASSTLFKVFGYLLSLLCVIMLSIFSSYFGTPSQIRWMPAYERERFAASATVQTNYSNARRS